MRLPARAVFSGLGLFTEVHVLGGLFVAWALFQAMGAVLVAVIGRADVSWPMLAAVEIVDAFAWFPPLRAR